MDLQYWHWLAILSLFFIVLEQVMPWHRPHRFFRDGWLRDLGFLAINGHFFGAYVLATATTWLQSVGMVWNPEAPLASHWPTWVQFLAILLVRDFIQWATHITLHRVPVLWEFHKVHHSIPRLDWAANFHYHWFENIVYTLTQAIPMALLGVPGEVAFWVYVAGTFWGHFNHSNIPLRIGWLGYLMNSPHMHQWHHDASAEGGTAKNFGIVLSLWDWIFGTAYWPQDREPERLGYPGDDRMPSTFGGQTLWPLTRLASLRIFRG